MINCGEIQRVMFLLMVVVLLIGTTVSASAEKIRNIPFVQADNSTVTDVLPGLV